MATARKTTRKAPATPAQPQASRGANLTTVLLGTWLMIGLFIDGWAHTNLPGLETFFTPWHAIFYSGFVATAAYLLWVVSRHVRPHGGLLTPAGRAAVPAGYGWGIAGVILFGFGGVGDMIWHIVFGIEQNTAALLSPTHLLLFMGGMLIMTTPLRAAWAAQSDTEAPSFRQFFPTLLSATMATAFIAFMLMYLWAPEHSHATMDMQHWYDTHGGAARDLREVGDIAGIANYLVTSLMLMIFPLLTLTRWRLPFGAVTFLWTVVALLMGALHAFADLKTIAGFFVLGLVADVLIRLLRVGPGRVVQLRIFGAVLPVLIWSTYFLVLKLMDNLGWPPETFGGVIAWSGIAGLGLTLLLVPQSKPRI